MRLALFIICVVTTMTTACKLEASSSTSNENINTSAQTNVSTTTATADAQSNCSLTQPAIPAIEGLRLGMSRDELLALFPGSKEDPDVKRYLVRQPDQFGDAELVIRPSNYRPKDEPVRVKQISFDLLDGRVYRFNVGYNGPQYRNVDDFIRTLTDGTPLSRIEEWQPFTGMENLKIIKCKDFEINAFVGGQRGTLNYVIVKDTTAEKKLDERRKKAEANATPTP